MEWIIGIVILMPAFAVGLFALLTFVLLGSIVFMTLGKWIFRLFGGCIVLRLYFAGDRCSQIAKGDVEHRRTNRPAAHPKNTH